MSRINKTRNVTWLGTCTSKCWLDASVSNDKQHWNNHKCRCECKELIDTGRSYDGFIWNSSICECECDKSCDIGECLENFKCRKRLIDKLLEECSKDINGNEIIHNGLFIMVKIYASLVYHT